MTNTINHALTEIAQRHFQIETLETRKSDSLDFHDVSIWSIKDALIEAYELGKKQNSI